MLFVFDLDGTLLNTIDDLAAAANHALRTCGFVTRSVEECRQFVGNGVNKLLERALPAGQRTPENLAKMKGAFVNYYSMHLADTTRPYEGILETLTALQVRGIKLAVLSNKYQQATEKLITHFFPSVSFVAVFGQRPGVPLKPHPQGVQDILRLVHEDVAHCLYVGDSQIDMQTAQQAAVKACAVTWGFRTRAELGVYHPAYMIDHPRELLQLI